jgi:molybdopterin molybdotransferase
MANIFITVEEAKMLIRDHCSPLQPVNILLADACNTVLAEDLYSPVNMPAFDQSAMDGYALAFDDLRSYHSLTITGESFAGITNQLSLQSGSAIRIFTGAPLPSGADTVVMQEQVARKDNEIILDPSKLTRGQNVRLQGSEINKGSLAIQKEELLTPAAIGFLTGLGFTQVMVHPFPSVSIITTGKEIIAAGHPLQFGQVYESNSITLKTALQQFQIRNVNIVAVDDEMDALKAAIKHALQVADLVLITGGVSVGDYDLVPSALSLCGVQTIFHKVKQRPGKPLLFGSKEQKLVFGLPGNPSSVLSCFYNFVVPCLQLLMNRKTPFIETKTLKMKEPFTKQIPLTQFLKGIYNRDEVVYLGAQESFRMSSFAVANCLIEIPADKSMIEKGELVEVHVIG